MNSYAVTSAQYDASFPFSPMSGGNDPLVYVSGTVDGVRVFVQLLWQQLIQANVVGGQSTARLLLAPIMFSAYEWIANSIFNIPVLPTFNLTSAQLVMAYATLPTTGDPTHNNLNPATCSQALVGSWTA